MYYVRDIKTGKLVYISRFQRACRAHINRMRSGLQLVIEHEYKGVIR